MPTTKLINIRETNYVIHWLEIYPVDSVIHLSSNYALLLATMGRKSTQLQVLSDYNCQYGGRDKPLYSFWLSLLLLYLFLHDSTCFVQYNTLRLLRCEKRIQKKSFGENNVFLLFLQRGIRQGLWSWFCLLQEYYTKKYCGNLLEMEESCSERQESELQAIQAIYMDEFQDLREKVTSLKF